MRINSDYFYKKYGFAGMLATFFILGIALLIVLAVSILVTNEQKIRRNLLRSAQAYFVSEAGIEDSIYRIVKGKKYEASNVLLVGEGGADINISSTGNIIAVESAGAVSQRLRKLKVELAAGGTNIAFHYGAQVGRGGLNMQPNAKVTGNVYSNGSILGSGLNSVITSDAWVAGGTETTPNQEWTVQDSGFSFGLRSGSTDYLDTVQSFVPSESKLLNKVSFYIKKVGNPPDQTIRILTDNGGKPSRTFLASGTLKSAKVTANYSWIDVSLGAPPSLVAGQRYWLTVDVSRDDNNYWVWGKDGADGYVFGTAKYTDDWSKNNAVWQNVGGDLDFKIWLAGIATEINSMSIGASAHANRILDSSVSRDAYCQYIEGTTVGGATYLPSPDPPVEDLPLSYAQIQDWETAAAKGGEIIGPYSPADGSLLGPVKIAGDLILVHDTTIIINGPVWVTGNIIADNNVVIKLPENLPSGYAVIADNPLDQNNFGKIKFSNNIVTQDSSLDGRLLFISTNNSVDLSNPAIDLSNNINATDAQSIIFSLQGLIKVTNNAKFKEITGYALYLANNAEVVYDTGLINANFSSGPGEGWIVRDWQEIQ